MRQLKKGNPGEINHVDFMEEIERALKDE